MILLAERFVKLAILVVFSLAFLTHKWHFNRITRVICIIVILFSGLVGLKTETIAPRLTDEVTLTALGEKNEQASRDEVWLNGFIVDGEIEQITFPKSGKWFWGGEHYMWRNENDARQPDGTTRKVVFPVPVGWDRRVQFATSEWSGFVSVSCMGETVIVDTYGIDGAAQEITLPQSSKQLLLMQSGIRIAVFITTILLTFLLESVFLKEYCRDKVRVFRWLSNNKSHLICLVIAVLSLVCMIRYSAHDSLWNDEIWQIVFGLENENIFKQLFITHDKYYVDITTPILAYLYRILPFGEQWLLLPTEIVTICGIYLLANTIFQIYGARAEVLAMLLGSINTSLLFQCGYEYRGYGLLFLLCCIALYAHVWSHRKEKANNRDVILYAIAIWLPTTTHIFGVFFSAGLVLIDILHMAMKTYQIKWFFSYVTAVVLYIPWIYNMLCCQVLSIDASWQGKPSLDAAISLLHYLTGGNNFLFYLLLMGAVLTIIHGIKSFYQNTKTFSLEITPIFTTAFVIAVVYAYGKWISPNATMWMERYFIVLFPCVIWMQVCAADSLCAVLAKRETIFSVCFTLALIGGLNTKQRLSEMSPTGYQHFREAADWFYTQPNTVYNKDTLIIYAPDAPYQGWQEYYLTKQGVRDPLQIVSQYSLKESDIREMKVVYVYYEHIGMFESTRYLLEQNGFCEIANDSNLKIYTFVAE